MKCRFHSFIAIAIAATLAFVGCGITAYAQNQLAEKALDEIAELVNQDENVDAADLDISKPRILPTNAFYVFKNLYRDLRIVLAPSMYKAELALRFADERLLELKSVSEKTKDPNIQKPVLEHYQSGISRLRKPIRPDSAEAVNDFLTRLIDHQLYHYKFLGKLEKEIPPEAFGALKHAKDEIIETLAGVPLEFENPESFRKRLEMVMASQDGSRFKYFKNLEIIKALQDKTPKRAHAALRQVEENAQRRLLEISRRDMRDFESYVGEIGGNEILHVEVIDDLKRADLVGDTQALFRDARNIALRRIETRLERFKDEAQKTEFLGYLEKGTLKHILTIRELENNIAPELSDTILEVKTVALADFGRTLLHADTPKKREQFLEEVERSRGTKTFDALEEIAKTLPDDDQALLTEMKQRVVQKVESRPAGFQASYDKNYEPKWSAGKEWGETWRARLERTLKRAEDLEDQPSIREEVIGSWYQALISNARDALKETAAPANIQADRAYKAFSELENGMYILKNTALYQALQEHKTPEFLRPETQRKLAVIFLDLKPRACGHKPSLIVVPLICKNGRWQRAPSNAPEPAGEACRPTGCSKQICADEEIITTCEFKPEYVCYKQAGCERQTSDECGWTATEETRACLERSQTAPSL